MHHFSDFKKAYDLVWRQVLYNILNEFGYHHETGKGNETFRKVGIGKHLSNKFPVKNGL